MQLLKENNVIDQNAIDFILLMSIWHKRSPIFQFAVISINSMDIVSTNKIAFIIILIIMAHTQRRK